MQDSILAESGKGKTSANPRPTDAMRLQTAFARLRQKRRHGLLRLWAFERLAAALARAGLTAHISIVYREGIAETEPPQADLSDATLSFASVGDLAAIAAVDSYGMPLVELEQRIARGARCYLLRCGGQVVAFTWCERDGPPRPRLGRTFGPSDAYLFDAHTAPAWRGRNLLPFLRHRLYRELRGFGCTGFFSSTAAFNAPAHRFKRKLGARPLEARLYLRLFGRLEKVFVIWRFSAG